MEIIKSAVDGALEDIDPMLKVTDDAVVATALLSGNYPEDYEEKAVIQGIEDIDDDNVELYYNDVGMNSFYEISTTGGRAFFITARAGTLNKAVDDLYENIDKVKFDGVHYYMVEKFNNSAMLPFSL